MDHYIPYCADVIFTILINSVVVLHRTNLMVVDVLRTVILSSFDGCSFKLISLTIGKIKGHAYTKDIVLLHVNVHVYRVIL